MSSSRLGARLASVLPYQFPISFVNRKVRATSKATILRSEDCEDHDRCVAAFCSRSRLPSSWEGSWFYTSTGRWAIDGGVLTQDRPSTGAHFQSTSTSHMGRQCPHGNSSDPRNGKGRLGRDGAISRALRRRCLDARPGFGLAWLPRK